MTGDQAAIAVPILNSYAHQYLGLTLGDVAVGAGEKDGQWILIVAASDRDEVVSVADFDDAKAIIDRVAGRSPAQTDAGDGANPADPPSD